MKKMITPFLVYLSFAFGAHAQTFEFDSISYKQLEIGKMEIDGDTWVIRVSRAGSYEDFMPVNLPERYKSAGQDVVFEGAIGRIPMQVKLAGTPIKLSMIRVLYKTKPNNDNAENVVHEDNNEFPSSSDSVGYIHNGSGKIILIGDVYIIEYKSNGELKRFVPDYLPDEFKNENTEITFSAVIRSVPPNVRMMGTPITIKELMMVEEMQIDNSSIQESLKSYFPFDSTGYLHPAKGTIVLVHSSPDAYLIEIQTGANELMRYIPVVLPDEFKKQGIVVIVSGTIGAIPPNVRLMGTPLTLDEIKLAD